MTTRCINAPRMKPISGTIRKPSQKLPVDCKRGPGQHGADHEEVAVRELMMSSRPKMIERPSAMSAMIRPQIRPFIASNSSVSIMR